MRWSYRPCTRTEFAWQYRMRRFSMKCLMLKDKKANSHKPDWRFIHSHPQHTFNYQTAAFWFQFFCNEDSVIFLHHRTFQVCVHRHLPPPLRISRLLRQSCKSGLFGLHSRVFVHCIFSAWEQVKHSQNCPQISMTRTFYIGAQFWVS